MISSDTQPHRLPALRSLLKDLALASAMFLLVPALIWAAAGQFWFVDRAWINLDYLLLGSMMLLRRSWLWPLLLIGLIGLDIVFALAPAYHFSPGSVAMSATEVLRLAPAFAVSRALLVLLLAGLAGWLLFRSTRAIVHRRLSSLGCAALLLLSTGADAVLSGSTLSGRDATDVPVNLAFSGMNNARVAWATSGDGVGADATVAPEFASRSLHADLRTAAVRERNVVVVVVESLGRFADPDLQAWQLAPLLALDDDPRLHVRSGSVEFSGSTVPGELRELCGIRLHNVHPDATMLPVGDCLPSRMRDAGYQSLAVHGYLGSVFSRELWYPAVGFDRVWFAPQLASRVAPKRCGIAYNGWCDREVWQAIVRELSSRTGPPRFVYWLTLSAHLPVAAVSDDQAARLCSAPALAADGAACALLVAHHKLLTTIADDLRGELGAHTRLLLVGDHAPPFLDQESRSLFDSGRVPFVEVRPASSP